MSHRARHVAYCFAALALGGAAGLALPRVTESGAAAPATASVHAMDFSWEDQASQTSTATIAQGGTVTFSYPSGASFHSVVFNDRQPTSCAQMPASPSPPGWSGSCTFDAAGTYTFVCGLHAMMTGSIVVEGPGGGPAPTGTGTTPGETDTTGKPSKPPRVKVKRRQRGVVVRGSVTTPAGPSRIQVRAFVAQVVLALPAASAKRLVRVGSFTKRSTGTGRTAFSIRLKRTARSALKRRGRLAVRLRIAVTPAGGRPTVTTAAVALRSK